MIAWVGIVAGGIAIALSLWRGNRQTHAEGYLLALRHAQEEIQHKRRCCARDPFYPFEDPLDTLKRLAKEVRRG